VAVWQTILSAGLLAVFAFIGFEGIVNVAEETKDPERNLPRAILATLVITTLIYVVVVWVSLVTLGPDTLGETEAPLANVFVRLTGWPATVMAAIAIVATLTASSRASSWRRVWPMGWRDGVIFQRSSAGSTGLRARRSWRLWSRRFWCSGSRWPYR
jgi:amino acid transporter